MITFVAVTSNGIPAYTIQPSDDSAVVEGSLLGNYTMQTMPQGVNLHELLTTYYFDQGWRLLPEKTNTYHIWDLATKTWKDPRTLDEIKIAKNSYLNEARLAANQTSFLFSGKSIAVDQLSRGDIDAVNGVVTLTNEMPAGWQGAWKAIDNTYVSLPDKAAWIMFYKAMVGQGSANFAHSQALKARVAAATTIAQVEAIVW
jgi:hypothetical protein